MKRKSLVGMLVVALTLLGSLACGSKPEAKTDSKFITIENGVMQKNGAPYYYVGTNFWYGAILGSEGTGGDRDRLLKELDFLKKSGITNLRVLVGSDGDPRPAKVGPSLQLAPGVYNDTILDGLDYFMAELGKRDMEAVLYLNNSWEWSGGYSQYLEWAGVGVAPVPSVDGFPAFQAHVKQFATNSAAQELFFDYVRFIVGRTNKYTGKKYSEDPALMSWQVGNEPRAFDKSIKEEFATWLAKTSALIKELDPNHLVSIGSEGRNGCEGDMELWEKIHTDKNVDYLTLHCWPKNWKMIDESDLEGSVDNAIKLTMEYIDAHLVVANKLNKPAVLEEFGFPRDENSIDKHSSTTTIRDKYYSAVFNKIVEHSHSASKFVGCNFWAWGGFGEPSHDNWQLGDQYVGDPPQEGQGLNSVFVSDKSTIDIIATASNNMNKQNK